MNKENILINFKDYTFYYSQERESPALKNVNLTIEKGNFTVLCGKSGSGKTTLLKHLKSEIKPSGISHGEIILSESLSAKKHEHKIAYVMENPSNQIIMDSVWHEIAFGLENQGVKPKEIERRVAEIANFFGIESWINKRIAELSGGEKQILNLASNMILQPDLLVLDEPTAELDPIARREFLQMLFYAHYETGMTILISEHNLSDLLEVADQAVFLDQGEIVFAGSAQDLTKFLLQENHVYQEVLPVAARVAGLTKTHLERYPISIKEGRYFLEKNVSVNSNSNSTKSKINNFILSTSLNNLNKTYVKRSELEQATILEADRIWYRYNPEDQPVLKETSFRLYENEIFAILGGNGSGKSTLLYLLSQAFQPLKGKIKIKKNKRVAMLGQNPEATFSAESVKKVLTEYQDQFSYHDDEISQIVKRLGIEDLLNRHPFDLSAGEKQRVALAKILLIKPDILLLDEPVKSLDVLNQDILKTIFLELKETMSIVFVTHDLDFTAEIADRCAMIFNNRLIGQAQTKDFFQKNNYFTSTTYRLTRNIVDGCINFSDIEQIFSNM